MYRADTSVMSVIDCALDRTNKSDFTGAIQRAINDQPEIPISPNVALLPCFDELM
jgi:polygalacturonase